MHQTRRSPRRILVTLCVCAGLMLGYGVAAPSATADTAPSRSTAIYYASQILTLLNQERAANGLYALRSNSILVSAAHAHNLKMAAYNTLSHQLPGEKSLGDRLTAAGYTWRACGENVAWNSDWSLAGALYLQKVMYNETYPNDGHRRNILSKTFRDVGIDVAIDSTHHKLWLTEDFGLHT
jgi:uncharacterized protein YkwD